MGIHRLTPEDMARTNRTTLGDEVPISVFRLLRLMGMHKILGDNTGHTLYLVGKELGAGLDVDSLDGLLRLLTELKIGIPEVRGSGADRVVIFVRECITCSGLPDIGEMVCHFEGGIIAGALEKILKRPAKAVQTKGGSAGFDGCEFEVSLS